jgi:DNA-binding beta-propeller fold protein YncE
MFNNPAGVAVDANWNVYVADSGNDRIRRIAPDGTVTTVAGGAGRGFTDGGPATAQFARPVGIAIDALGNILVSELDNSAIRRINRAGVTQTLSASMMIVNPYGLTVTASGTVYVANRGSHNILRLVPQ